MSAILANSSASASGGMGMFGMIIWLVVIFGFMYFLMIRPQKKEQKKKDLMLSEVAVGDTVLTTSGFYGTIIDIVDDTVIVEFGNISADVHSCRKFGCICRKRMLRFIDYLYVHIQYVYYLTGENTQFEPKIHTFAVK